MSGITAMVQRNYRMPEGLADDLHRVCEMLGVEEAAMVRFLVARFVERRVIGGGNTHSLSGLLCVACGRIIGETMRQPTCGRVVGVCECMLVAPLTPSACHMAAGRASKEGGAEGG